jgi:25S rRNA (uracil2634-N3)-methyltransferase
VEGDREIFTDLEPMAKVKPSLKVALSSQQSRLRSQQKAAHAARAAEQKIKSGSHVQPKRKAKAKTTPPRTTIPFSPSDKILLIGEGNFSFARALVVDPPPELAHLPAKNVTATAYDTEKECYAKYPDAEAIVDTLREMGMKVLFEVDATKLESVPTLKGRTWNRIVWNFPHAGER